MSPESHKINQAIEETCELSDELEGLFADYCATTLTEDLDFTEHLDCTDDAEYTKTVRDFFQARAEELSQDIDPQKSFKHLLKTRVDRALFKIIAEVDIQMNLQRRQSQDDVTDEKKSPGSWAFP